MDIIIVTKQNFKQYAQLITLMYKMFHKEIDVFEEQLVHDNDIDTDFVYRAINVDNKFNPNRIMKNKLNRILLFQEGNNIVGFAELTLFYFYLKTREVNIQNFFIRPKFRGTGIAQQCLYTIFNYVKTNNLSQHNHVYLTVLKNNIRALKLYLKCGFKVHSMHLAPKTMLRMYLLNNYSNNDEITLYKQNKKQSSTIVNCYCNNIAKYYSSLNLPYQNLIDLYKNYKYLIVDEKQQMGVTLIKHPLMRFYFCPDLNINDKEYINLYLANVCKNYTDIIGCINLVYNKKYIDILFPTYALKAYYMYRAI